eukprot:gene27353-4654_t
MPYWLVSLPLLNKRRDTTWEVLQEKTSGLCTTSKFEIPELRIGTLDTLMALSDDLAKNNQSVEAIVAKIRRQVGELGGPGAPGALKVEGLPPDAYLGRFKWEEAKFPSRRPLKETVEKITEIIARIEDELKVKVAEYNTLKGQMSAAARKTGGSLAVRDVSSMVKPTEMVDSENLSTLFVIVAKYGVKEWEQQYETMCNYVVPRSSKLISEDNDYALVTVVMFKRVVDDFKAAARSKGFQVREYSSGAESSDLTPAQVEQLKKDVELKKGMLEKWCQVSYGEAFAAWMHLNAVRIFVESILRYGLPPAYQAALVKPVDKADAKLRAALDKAFSDAALVKPADKADAKLRAALDKAFSVDKADAKLRAALDKAFSDAALIKPGDKADAKLRAALDKAFSDAALVKPADKADAKLRAALDKAFSVAALIKPADKADAKLRAALDKAFSDAALIKPGDKADAKLRAALDQAFSVATLIKPPDKADARLRAALDKAFSDATLIKPVDKADARLRAALDKLFSDGKSSYWKDDGPAVAVAGIVADTDMHSYVSLTINIEV